MNTQNKIPIKDFPKGSNILLRCDNYRFMGGTINRVCMVLNTTEKAVLLKVDRDGEEDITMDIAFWLPKAAMYMIEGEKKVYYLKSWAKIVNIWHNN